MKILKLNSLTAFLVSTVFVALLLVSAFAVRAANFVLTPIDEYLGIIPGHVVCSFAYSEHTVFAPNTLLTVDPYTEEYGVGSVIFANDGMTCSDCYVSEYVLDSNGVTTFYYDAAR